MRPGTRGRTSRSGRWRGALAGRGTAGLGARRLGEVGRLQQGREELLRLAVVADRRVVRHHTLEVDEEMVRGVARLDLPTAADLAVGVVGERRGALVRLLALVLVRDLPDARQERVERVLAGHAARFGERVVAAGLGRRGRRAGIAGVGAVGRAAVVGAAGAAGQQRREEGGDAGYVGLPLHGQAPLDGGFVVGPLPVFQCPRWLFACRTGAPTGDNVYRTHCRGRRSAVPFVDLGAGFAISDLYLFSGGLRTLCRTWRCRA